ncbi:MAG: alpha/beta fold hydrolase [Spirochaetales bacterium]|nr:alpha/beta fold hydrolase [Spirochaetales bacterium]
MKNFLILFTMIVGKTYSTVLLFFLVCLQGALTGCAVFEQPPDKLFSLRESLAQEAGPLESAVLPQSGPFVTEYFIKADSYNPDYHFPGSRIMGYINTTDYRLGVVLLLPPHQQVLGTIIAFHGYAAYSAFNLPALYQLAEDGWAVLAVDLPGHGFSNGYPGDIREFSQYGVCISDIIAWIKNQHTYTLPKPFILLGHSTGGSAVLEALWEYPADIDMAILLAPLIEPRNFEYTSCIASFLSPFMYAGPMVGPKQGYLSPEVMPFTWVKALSNWRKILKDRPLITIPVLIVQGDADKTLDWKKGMNLLKHKIPDATIKILSDRGHTLFNHDEAQAETIAEIREFLNITDNN